MALVSGRPISFRMDLYQPLYAPRPLVEPELFASLRPPSYSGALDAGREVEGVKRAQAEDRKEALALRAAAEARGGNGRAAGGGAGSGGGRQGRELAGGVAQRLGERMDLAQGVASAASAARLGDFF